MPERLNDKEAEPRRLCRPLMMDSLRRSPDYRPRCGAISIIERNHAS
ncbi:MAG: hypothetical protein H0T56_04695 [Pseudaminobacter sp.]|nr:hypothetical protein [Pseudaminobacter sp.]